MMEGILIGVLCLSGCFTFSTCLLRQYHFVSEPMTWTEAQSYCRETYTDLVTIENTEEMKQLKDTVPAAGKKVWIGLYSVIDWKWSDGFTGTGPEYTKWAHGEPNHLLANELCVAMRIYGHWNDIDCQRRFASVCYRGALEDPDFVAVNTTKTWSEAQRHCRKHYTDLATVRNVTDNDKIKNLRPPGGYAWIGLYRDPQIYWSDGSNNSFSSWGLYINFVRERRVCGVAVLMKGGNWRLYSCGERFPFVCYSNPTAKTFVKVRVKLQDSSVDMNDPAVKAHILEKLQQRLKEKGHNHITLKWKEKADGKVFEKEKKKTEL